MDGALLSFCYFMQRMPHVGLQAVRSALSQDSDVPVKENGFGLGNLFHCKK